MPKDVVSPRIILAWSCLVLTSGNDIQDSGKDFYDLKCSACTSMVAELERNLETERPKMNVDLRKTLAGGDKGKKVDYMVSEVRTLELLEGLCPGMKDYGIVHQEDGSATFQRYNVAGGSQHIGGRLTLGDDAHRVNQVRLESHCYATVEAHEDTLAEVIRAAGLAKKAREEERLRRAKAKRKGEALKDEDPYHVLEIEKAFEGDDAVNLANAKKAYRALSKKYHPDKSGGDPEAVKKFVAIAQAYEKITGEELTPYGDLYRQVCLDLTGECKTEAEVEKQKYFFPRYENSEKFGNAGAGGLDEADARRKAKHGNADKEKKKKNRKKKKPKNKKPSGGEL